MSTLETTKKSDTLDDSTQKSLKQQADMIHRLSLKTYPKFQDTPFIFTLSKKAAEHNSKIIAKYDYDMEKVLNATTKNTQLEYGSEFRPSSDLEPILTNHPLWPKTKDILNQGCNVAFSHQDIKIEKEDLQLGLKRGNHKGAVNQNDDLTTLITKDVTHGYALPLNNATAENIKGGAWAPLNIQEQWTINERGDRIKKKRLTHDQSFPGLVSDKSINDRVDLKSLEPLIYGYMFLRVIHMIHGMRLNHPNIAILL